jgi:hypothetical protein
MARFSSHPGDAARVRGQRFKQGTYIERLYVNAKRGWSESEGESSRKSIRYGGSA